MTLTCEWTDPAVTGRQRAIAMREERRREPSWWVGARRWPARPARAEGGRRRRSPRCRCL